MEQHYVIFYSPGTFGSEQTRREVDSWDVEQATEMASEIVERYDAKPYGFQFITRARKDDELDASETARSAMYYLGGEVLTLEQVEARKNPDDIILLSNMRGTGYDKIIVNTNSWKFTAPLEAEDTVLDFKMPA